jgi:hypothetical protein
MKTVIGFQITYNSDKTEGRGSTRLTDIVFENKDDALTFVGSKEYAKKYGVMGSKGSRYDVKEVELNFYSSMSDFNEREVELKEHALSKLTKKEKEILGLI